MLTKQAYTQLIVLIDPDKFNPELIKIIDKSNTAYIFVGGSILKESTCKKIVKAIKAITKIPVIIFPGDFSQLARQADGILIPSLLSGRNAEYLIGKHVKAATNIKNSNVNRIPMGYILIDGERKSTTQKITKTNSLTDRTEIINTAIAGELLGKKLIYLEAGSGATKTIDPSLIKEVKRHISIPLIVGGGIDSISKAKLIMKSKPDYLVVGNALEKNPYFLIGLNSLFHPKKQSQKNNLNV